MESIDARLADNPFPGLRSFQPDEADVFFGRRRQIDDLLWRLDQAPLIAVAGSSGCGKSSLVLAGLLHALARPRDDGDDIEWRPVVMRPGNDPIGNLARALAAALTGPGPEDPTRVAALAGRLRLGGIGLAEAVRLARLPRQARLLVVVDQFEEIFRYRRMTDPEECGAFVKLILHAANTSETPVQVVLTLRSEALGHCADFRDLPEAVSRGQFLVPRLTREQRKEAITGPIERRGFTVAPRLVQRVLNDVSDDFDDLPVMQHALSQTWARWARQAKGARPIDIEDYEAVGTAKHAISQHADEAFASLPGLAGVVERVFRALTERLGAAGSEVRRPLPFDALCAVVAAAEGEVAQVVERFRRVDTVFLLPAPEVALATNPVIDISHESLIRGWVRLRDWAEREAASAHMYRRVAESARRFDLGEEELLRDRALQFALDWREQARPTAQWAALYEGDFERAMAYLDASLKARDAERRAAERARTLKRQIFIASFVGIAGLAAVMTYERQRSDTAFRAADQATRDLKEKNKEIETRAVSRRLALEANRMLVAGRLETALLLASAALQSPARAEEAQEVMRKALLDAPRRLLRGHASDVEKLAFSPDSATLASVEFDGQVLLWDANKGEVVDRTIRTTQAEGVAAFAADGALLVAPDGAGNGTVRDPVGAAVRVALEQARSDGGPLSTSSGSAIDAERGRYASARSGLGIRVWDLRSGKLLATLPEAGAITRRLAFSPDGRSLAAVQERRGILLWEFGSGKPARRLQRAPGEDVTASAFSADGTTLAAVVDSREIVLWDPARGRVQRRIAVEAGGAEVMAFSGDGARLATGGEKGSLVVYESASGAELWRAARLHDGRVHSLAFNRNGRSLASGSENGHLVVTRVDGSESEPRQLRGLSGPIRLIAFSADGRRLASAADRAIAIWDVGDSRPRHGVFEPSLAATAALAFEPGGRYLLLAGEDSFVYLWNVARGRRRDQLAGANDALASVAASRDGRFVAAGSEDGSIRIWELETHALIAELQPAHGDKVSAIDFSPDGRTLATGSRDNTVMVWDLHTRVVKRLPKKHAGEVTSLAFSPDGERLATASRDRSVIVWDLVSGTEPVVALRAGLEINAVAYSPDGALLAVASRDRTIRLWNPATRDVQSIETGHSVVSLAFDPKGETLAAGEDLGAIRLWDVKSRSAIGDEFEGHTGAAWSVAFSPDGGTMASAGADGRLIVWDTDVRNWAARACRIVNRDIREDEWPRSLRGTLTGPVCPR